MKKMNCVLAGLMAAAMAMSTPVFAAEIKTAEEGELHMATNAAFEPYEYVEGGQVVGIDAEIAKAICDKLGYKLVIDDMDFDAIITAVTSGSIMDVKVSTISLCSIGMKLFRFSEHL